MLLLPQGEAHALTGVRFVSLFDFCLAVTMLLAFASALMMKISLIGSLFVDRSHSWHTRGAMFTLLCFILVYAQIGTSISKRKL